MSIRDLSLILGGVGMGIASVHTPETGLTPWLVLGWICSLGAVAIGLMQERR